MMPMVICNCPRRSQSTNSFAPCACCSSGEHTDPECIARSATRTGITLLLEAVERADLERHAIGKGRDYPPKWARRERA